MRNELINHASNMNQRQFDECLTNPDAWEEGIGWVNNPIRSLFENPRQQSEPCAAAEDEKLETIITTKSK